MPRDDFTRFGGFCALVAGVGGFCYAVAFVVLQRTGIYSPILLANGIFATAALVALFEALTAGAAQTSGANGAAGAAQTAGAGQTAGAAQTAGAGQTAGAAQTASVTPSPGWARWALLLAIVGQIGAAVHGAYDTSTVFGPGAADAAAGAAAASVNMTDPRGFLTFFVSGLALLVFGMQIRRAATLPPNLGSLGMVYGLVLIWIYLARLLIVEPTNPLLLVPVLLGGFVLGPAWYLWLGNSLIKR